MVITIFFWSVLFPFDDGVYSSKRSHWFTFIDHICPFAFTTMDWMLCNMRYEKTTFWINMAVALVYGIVNILFTYITGNAVYPPVLTWDSLVSWMIGLAIIPFWGFIFFIEFWLNNWKLSKFSPTKPADHELLQTTTNFSV